MKFWRVVVIDRPALKEAMHRRFLGCGEYFYGAQKKFARSTATNEVCASPESPEVLTPERVAMNG
ncbi:MAG: hypothetical protein HUU20_19875 [Pirellulales bacterium]|nr:hypothetical protein [Pirellulales bacterium]